jgi:acetyl esterase/lipase
MPRRLALVVLLSCLLAVPTAAAQDASPVPKPAQPTQPESGPGGEETAFPAARFAHYGPEPGGYWIWEPATGTDGATPAAAGVFPVVLYLSGCCGFGEYPTPEEVEPWLTHVTRQGHVVIATVYHAPSVVEDVPALLREALAELEQPGHVGIDTERFAVLGYSYGGVPSILYAASAQAEGLPVPKALFLTAPCTENGFCVDLPAEAPALPPGLKAVLITYSHDFLGPEQPRRIWQALAALPEADRDFVTMTTDYHGSPPILARHETTYRAVDAADWYGIWKLSEGLLACAFEGRWCEYALGNTPEQRFMGTWSDGVPVTELVVTDSP